MTDRPPAHPAGDADPQRDAANLMFPHAELTPAELWIRYFSLGGDADPVELEAYLQGLMPLTALDRDVLAHAINERLDEVGWPPRVPYSRQARRMSIPDSGPLAALVELLDGAYLAPPERLPALAERAAARLGVGVVVYVADYPQRMLVPLSSPAATGRTPLRVDGTLGGRAYRQVRTVPARHGGVPRLWVPILDGVERLGVLEVLVRSDADLDDPGLRAQCRWLSAQLGHLLTAMNGYGDVLDAVRRPSPRSVGEELLWSLLPPLTTGVDGFMLSGMVQPSPEGRGDAFDYGLSADRVSLALFDAMGHDLEASLIAATALAAYRTARRSGADVLAQARLADEAVATRFPDAFCTAVLAQLDLQTGRLRYVVAGHPPPLVVRGGRVVRRLAGGHRRPLGLGCEEEVAAEETLQPGDWLALYTDGVTEARGPGGEQFGEERLADLLRRALAAGEPPPETARRLTAAVLDHVAADLVDDATVLLASWNAYALADYQDRHIPDAAAGAAPHAPAGPG